jgi:hypothetical protein
LIISILISVLLFRNKFLGKKKIKDIILIYNLNDLFYKKKQPIPSFYFSSYVP